MSESKNITNHSHITQPPITTYEQLTTESEQEKTRKLDFEQVMNIETVAQAKAAVFDSVGSKAKDVTCHPSAITVIIPLSKNIQKLNLHIFKGFLKLASETQGFLQKGVSE